MSIFWASVLGFVVIVGWGLNLLSLPGNWFNLAATACYAWLLPTNQRPSIGWPVVGAVFVLVILGELVEMFASAAGTARAGGSRRSAVLGIIGSFAGGILGAVIGLPIPAVGSLAGIIVFASMGALTGAMLGERWKRRDWETTWRVGQAAFWGRLLGTIGKVTVGSVIVVLVLAALVLK